MDEYNYLNRFHNKKDIRVRRTFTFACKQIYSMRYLIICLIIICVNFNAQAQQVDRTSFRAGLNGGMVIGDFSEAYSLVLGVDLYQHWGLSKEVDLGVTTGFLNAFGEKEEISAGGIIAETEFDNVQFVPLGASVRIYPSSGFKIGGDVGYALGINEGNDGGFYYRPSLGVDINGGVTELNISYLAVDGDVTYSNVLFGLLFLF